jgi:7,8-dihydropterin-6-yl-methyl-4-(beta-D-ribofuranosyl)aminobenzene 5'-phosphate synthase
MPLRAVVVVDNEPGPGLAGEWGWSVYIEAHSTRVLFDADTDPGVLASNASRLRVDLSRLDFAVLSHHHADHYGGFPAVAEARPGLPVYVPPGDPSWAQGLSLEVREVFEAAEPAPGFQLSGPIKAWPGFYEQALGVRIGNGLVVFLGCSHPGGDRLAEALAEATGLPIYAVIGGLHRPSRATLDRLAAIAGYVCPTHCSGNQAKRYLEIRYPEKLCRARTGTVIVVDEQGRLRIEKY